MSRSSDRRSGRGGGRPVHPYPRTARVNSLVASVVANALERMADEDGRLSLITVTGVATDPDLRHATVFFASLSEPAVDALEEHRVRLQAAVGKGGRMKRTPTLSFAPDPAVAAGWRVEEALRRVHRHEP